jgi:hypothetical protein
MMSATEAGATFTYAEYRSWLTDAHLVDVEVRQPVPFQEVMIGRKAGGDP